MQDIRGTSSSRSTHCSVDSEKYECYYQEPFLDLHHSFDGLSEVISWRADLPASADMEVYTAANPLPARAVNEPKRPHGTPPYQLPYPTALTCRSGGSPTLADIIEELVNRQLWLVGKTIGYEQTIPVGALSILTKFSMLDRLMVESGFGDTGYDMNKMYVIYLVARIDEYLQNNPHRVEFLSNKLELTIREIFGKPMEEVLRSSEPATLQEEFYNVMHNFYGPCVETLYTELRRLVTTDARHDDMTTVTMGDSGCCIYPIGKKNTRSRTPIKALEEYCSKNHGFPRVIERIQAGAQTTPQKSSGGRPARSYCQDTALLFDLKYPEDYPPEARQFPSGASLT